MQKFKYNLGVIFVIAISAIAVLLWVLAPSTVFKFDSTLDVLRMLGQLFGILGFTLFGTNIILSARMHFLENIFYGLNKVYEHHARIGKIAFYLMLFHPLTLFFGYFGFTTTGLLDFFTPGLDKGPVNWGIAAFILMIILVSLTIYFRPGKNIKYHIWKNTHKFMGVVFFLGTIHAFLIPSDVSSFAPLKFYMLGIFVFASAAYVYHSVLGKFLIKKYKYIVSEVKVLAGGTVTEVSLRPAGPKMNFIPGQFAFISFIDEQVKNESHPFSLTSATRDETISFNMKNLGDYTSTLSKLSVGSQAFIEGPFGKFSYKEVTNKNQIWVAGGIGITPYLSMASEVSKEADYNIDLYYCLKNKSEAVRLEELKKLENESFRVIEHYSDTDGFINPDIIKEKSGGFEGKDIFLCAPPMMIEILRKGFIQSGVDKNRIHSEEFKLF